MILSFKEMLPSVHQLLRLYLTVPISSATSERSFSALKQLLTPFRASMTEQRLTNCFLLHVHKCLTDELDLTAAAKEFIDQTDERRKYFENFK